MPYPTEANALPRQGGTYVLCLVSDRDFELAYGRRRHRFGAGHFLYVGSAFGPGGLAARVGHHLRISAKPRWHIDRLRLRLPVLDVWYSTAEQRLEHRWAGALAARCETPVPGFGASDCRCDSHLFGFHAAPEIAVLANASEPPVLRLEIG